VGLAFIIIGEIIYSRFLADKIFGLSDSETTPANEPGHDDDPDYHATPSYILWGHHWTSITGAAPIVGPAMAAYYGWLPATLWVVFGCLFSGAVHDFSTLVLSARNGGRSIADVAGYVVSPRLRVIFLLLINFLCLLVTAKFMEVIAKLFVMWPETVLPVWMEIPMAVGLGFAAQRLKHSSPDGGHSAIAFMSLAILVALYAIVGLAVWIEDSHGDWDGNTLVNPVFGWKIGENGEICRDSVNYKEGEYTCAFGAMQFWTVLLCIYAAIAATLPVWTLLQPRDFINSHQLKVVLAGLIVGIVIKGPQLDAPAVRDELHENIDERSPIFPMMFTLVACGATSGFHGLVSSGVTSKQLDKMRDARPIGYSAMMGESMLSMVVIICVCSAGTWSAVYADGMNWTGFLTSGATFLEELRLTSRFARTVMNVLVVSFAATTLDSAMRIQRILVGELGTTAEGVAPSCAKLLQKTYFQVALSALPPLYIANSRSIAAVWNLFGATNQLTACVSLLVVAVYVFRFRKKDIKACLPFIVPIVWLSIMISWALGRLLYFYLLDCQEKGCNWTSTIPTIPTVIIAFLIALLVLLTYGEIIYYFVSKKYENDMPIDEQGKLGMDVPGMPTNIGGSMKNIKCC